MTMTEISVPVDLTVSPQLKHSFRQEDRLYIAAQLLAARITREGPPQAPYAYEAAGWAVDTADALIRRVEDTQ